jgi:hypothetical protein
MTTCELSYAVRFSGPVTARRVRPRHLAPDTLVLDTASDTSPLK